MDLTVLVNGPLGFNWKEWMPTNPNASQLRREHPASNFCSTDDLSSQGARTLRGTVEIRSQSAREVIYRKMVATCSISRFGDH